MWNQREKDLVAAFRRLSTEQQALYYDSIADCARERDESAPILRLVANNSAVHAPGSLYSSTEKS
jgi:hypothetical protein